MAIVSYTHMTYLLVGPYTGQYIPIDTYIKIT